MSCYTCMAQVLLETIVFATASVRLCFCHRERKCVKTGGRWPKVSHRSAPASVPHLWQLHAVGPIKRCDMRRRETFEWEKQTELAQRRLAARPNPCTHPSVCMLRIILC